ncbi:hypothetical protein EVG20_g11562 [Dentipellis fragilis]|uniref:Major facilitator superfamily (MFS) profile domain-containing protein n=1 Tax=Dentipellis fragilis TaxID=205917 RepID=A0A4Y9XJR6_9AGAM|nr:hypothetical protein EVG20_g11562 [Dentipellis fragilis]
MTSDPHGSASACLHSRERRVSGPTLSTTTEFERKATRNLTFLKSIMQSPKILSTVFEIPSRLQFSRRPSRASQNVDDDVASSVTQVADPELKLPKMSSLVVMIALNALSQVSFFIIVSSSSKYAEYLGGSATFSGLVIGIPVVFAGVALIPLMRLDKGAYSMPLHFACANAILGHIFYGLAYRAHFLYLIFIGRIVVGFAFTNFMYSKRFCSDPRLVGIRRRTTLAGWLVVGQGVGFSVGPFVGGLLYKVGFGNEVFNGYTSPGWVMAVCWLLFWIIFPHMFQDVPKVRRQSVDSATELEAVSFPQATRTVTADLPMPNGDAEAKGGASTSVHNLPDDDAEGTGCLSARQWGRVRDDVLVRDDLVLRARRLGSQHPRLHSSGIWLVSLRSRQLHRARRHCDFPALIFERPPRTAHSRPVHPGTRMRRRWRGAAYHPGYSCDKHCPFRLAFRMLVPDGARVQCHQHGDDEPAIKASARFLEREDKSRDSVQQLQWASKRGRMGWFGSEGGHAELPRATDRDPGRWDSVDNCPVEGSESEDRLSLICQIE